MNPDLWDGKPYYSLSSYLKKEYKEKVYKLSLDGGMTCPNRDGTIGSSGCIFCSEGGSGDFASSGELSITNQIEDAKEKIKNKTSCKKFIAYFQAYTNTYAPVSYLRGIFTEAINHPDIEIVSIATRPDCLNNNVLDLLEELSKIKPVWIELGLQTTKESSAKFIRRGYPLSCFIEAVFALKKRNIPVIAHIILGLPKETRDDMLKSIDFVGSLGVFGIKIQLLHILKNTDLANHYLNHYFEAMSLEEYTDILIEGISHLPKSTVIHRITGDGPKNILIAPLWSSNKKFVLNTIHQEFKKRNSWQGKYRRNNYV